MDVSEEVLNNYLKYGGSERSSPETLSSSKCLNYASGATMSNPSVERVSTAGASTTYSDSVGLMGAENHFIRYDLNIIDRGNNYEEEGGWIVLYFSAVTETTVNTYEEGTLDLTADGQIINTYEPANWSAAIPAFLDSVVKISLENLKTNNIYVDNWFETRLYTQNKEEHPYDTMYVGLQDSFYVGFHARNTRRLPYNVKCSVTNDIKSARKLSTEEQSYIAR